MDAILTLPTEVLLIRFVGICSVLSAAIFALLGLFTEYKKDGVVTKYGRVSIIGIVLSATFSIGVSLLQSDVDRRKSEADLKSSAAKAALEARRAEKERNEQSERFRAQIASLTQLNHSMQDNIDRTRTLATRQEANTHSLLRNAWDNVNRVSDNSIAVVVKSLCVLDDGSIGAVPRLIPEGSTLTLAVTNGPDRIVLDAVKQEYASDSAFMGGLVNQQNYFSPLIGTYGVLRNIQSWRGKRIMIFVNGQNPGLAKKMQDMVFEGHAKKQLLLPPEVYNFTLYRRGLPGGRVPCFLKFELVIDGNLIGTGDGELFEIGGGIDERGKIVAYSDPLRLRPKAIPSPPHF